jgi:hypothetical protein
MLIVEGLALCLNRSLTISVYASDIAYNRGVRPSLSFESGLTRSVVRSSLITVSCFLSAVYDSGDRLLSKELLNLESVLTSSIVRSSFRTAVWPLTAAYDSEVQPYSVSSASELTFPMARSSLTTVLWPYIVANESGIYLSSSFKSGLTSY